MASQIVAGKILNGRIVTLSTNRLQALGIRVLRVEHVEEKNRIEIVVEHDGGGVQLVTVSIPSQVASECTIGLPDLLTDMAEDMVVHDLLRA